MAREGQRSMIAVAVWAVGFLPSCLPHDTRPEPGSVSVTVTGALVAASPILLTVIV